jgi:hypothetical protein
MANNDNIWINRTDIRSETSDRVYTVSQHATKRHWGCSCPGWKAHRRCKHLEQLGLPGGEAPFDVVKEHSKKNGFLDGYRTYDASEGRGDPTQWQKVFSQRMGLDEARTALGLSGSAGWDEVRQAFHLAATESMTRLVGDYERTVTAFDGAGAVEESAQAVRDAKFRLEAYAAYLEDQRQKLESEADRITGELLARIKAA